MSFVISTSIHIKVLNNNGLFGNLVDAFSLKSHLHRIAVDVTNGHVGWFRDLEPRTFRWGVKHNHSATQVPIRQFGVLAVLSPRQA